MRTHPQNDHKKHNFEANPHANTLQANQNRNTHLRKPQKINKKAPRRARKSRKKELTFLGHTKTKSLKTLDHHQGKRRAWEGETGKMEVRSAWSAMGGVVKGEREDGDGVMHFWVKTRSEVAGGWAAWSPVLEGWVLMVAGGWLSAGGGREREDGGVRERRWGGGKKFWKMKNVQTDKCCISFLFFIFF
jgi:hypothetical protein